MRKSTGKVIADLDERYRAKYPIGAKVKHNAAFCQRFRMNSEDERIGTIINVESRNGMVPAVLVSFDGQTIAYSTLADNLEVL